jgi:hypothetical protein
MRKLLMTLLIVLPLMTSSNLSKASVGDVAIKKNELAPFSGVLMPENNYRQIAKDMIYCDTLELELKTLKENCHEVQSPSHNMVWVALFTGFISGFLLAK